MATIRWCPIFPKWDSSQPLWEKRWAMGIMGARPVWAKFAAEKVASNVALFELDCVLREKPVDRRPSELTAWISVLYVITRVVRVIEFALKFFDHSCDPQWLHSPNCCRLPGFCSPTASTLPCPTVSPPIAWPICSGQCLDQKQQLCRYKNSSRLFDLKNHRSSSNKRFFGMFFIGTVGL
jgi:hypothetical protein